MATYYKRDGQSDADFFHVACLAPAALRLELTDMQGEGRFRIPYTSQFALLLLQCDDTFSSSMDDIPTINSTSAATTSSSSSTKLKDTDMLKVVVEAVTLNPDLRGQLVHHLGVENIVLPRVFAGLLLTALLLWLYWVMELCWTKPYVTSLHVGFALALGMKVLELALSMAYYACLDREGHVSDFFHMSFSLFEKLSMLSQLAMLVFLALGYKVHRPTLSTREVRLFILAFGLYIALSSSQAACENGGGDGRTMAVATTSTSSAFSSSPPSSLPIIVIQQGQGPGQEDKLCQAYELSEYVMQSLILLGVIVSINFNITSLRAALHDYPWSVSVPLHYASLSQFHFFRWLFLLYLLLPTFLLVTRIMLLSWSYAWLDQLLRQGIYLSIYVALAVTFAPTAKELYSKPFGVAAQWRLATAAIHPAERLRQRREQEGAGMRRRERGGAEREGRAMGVGGAGRID